jgi:hypothetical protein
VGTILPSNVSEYEANEKPTRGSAGSGRTALVGGLVLLVLVVGAALVLVQGRGIGPVAAPASRSQPAAAPTVAVTGATAVVGPTADAATAAAIQHVVQSANEAQARAIATRDPSPMAAAATPDYFQEMVQINQGLLDSGVTQIQLLRMDWGPITVSGTRAMASVVETWSTTWSDGTTRQSSDLNIYTLVNNGGAWKIVSDDHPDAGS